MRAAEIARLLAQDAEGVCRMLLPEGKRQGNEWCVGSVNGEPGDSCQVHLVGDKSGVWRDFASHEKGGDLLDLWAASKGLSLQEAISEAKSYLGIADTRFYGYQEPARRPERPKCHRPRGEVLQWLTSRGLTEPAIEAYKIAATEKEIVFPYLHEELMFCKLRNIHDKSKMRVVKDSVPCLFGWQAVPGGAREVVICEGELDAPSWWMMGYPALSVPNGANGYTWLENEYDRLERFDTIYLAFDADEPGRKGALEVAERLGIERCRIVDTSPWKDANDVVQAGQHMVGGQLIAKAKAIAPEELKSATEFTDAVVREFFPSPDMARGFFAPWPKCEHKVMFRYSELTIINGVNGHGKSQMAGQLALAAMQQGERVCIASMEIKPERLLYRLTRQAMALHQGDPTESYIREVMEWYRDKCWIFDLVGTAKTKRLLEVFRYARNRFDVRVFLVDSLLKCGIAEDDYVAQKAFVEALCDFKNETDSHVLLVTHSRKRDDENNPTGKMDVRGAGAITDLADNVTTIWRNKKKEAEIGKADSINAPVEPSVLEKPDSLWIWDKQRNGEWEGRFAFWWHGNSFNFIGKEDTKPKPVIQFRQEQAA